MKSAALPLSLAALVLVAGCATPPDAPAPKTASEADVAGARAAASQLGGKLKNELQAAMSAGGPEAAVGVCKERAPALAAEVSASSGYRVSRVSAKNRNPNGAPDAWEAAALAALETRLAAGEPADKLEIWEVVPSASGPLLRYARAAPTAPLCLTCHGAAENLPAGVKARLTADYPHDRATGFAVGQLRGAFSVQKPL
jgi:hypothetical protein